MRSCSSLYSTNVTSLVLCFCSGATVYMVCRNKERGEVALSEIQSATGNKNVFLEVFGLIFLSLIFAILSLKLLMACLLSWQVCDLSSISDVKSFASRFCAKDVPIHILVNSFFVDFLNLSVLEK